MGASMRDRGQWTACLVDRLAKQEFPMNPVNSLRKLAWPVHSLADAFVFEAGSKRRLR